MSRTILLMYVIMRPWYVGLRRRAMFKQLTAFGAKRSAAQALGFYLAYCLLAACIGGFAAELLSMAGVIEGFDDSIRVGAWIAIPFSMGIGLAVAFKKRRASQFAVILSFPVIGVLALFGGALLGLLIPAFFTTLNSADSDAQVEHEEPSSYGDS